MYRQSKQQKRRASKSAWESEATPSVMPERPLTAADLNRDSLTPDTVQRLQSTHGNQFVQRLVAEKRAKQEQVSVSEQPAEGAVQRNEDDLPAINHLPEMAQKLLEGVLEKSTINGAVRQLYDNLFAKPGWKYRASNPNVVGKSFIESGKDEGMCESYRNTFAYMLTIYDTLRKTHPVDAVKNGALDVQPGDDLVNDRLYTIPGLTLMGSTALKGNVYLQVDGAGNVVQNGFDNVKTFIFKGHWTLVVNGVNYDPIFHSPGVSTLGGKLDKDYSDGKARYLANTSKPIPSGEFSTTFLHVTDFTAFSNLVATLAKYYTDHQVDIDWMLGSNFLERWGKGIFKMKNADLVKNTKALVKGQIADQATFMQVVELACKLGGVSRPQKQAIEKVIKLANT